jgi:DNA (cytosine-5)-methyltransferase 1
MVCKWQVEIDDYANKVLAKHWPNVHRERDIRECGKHNLESVDVICGGFPCQDISYAGLGAGLDGERSGLFFEAIRVVRELRPRIVVLENVAALLTRGLDRVLGTVAEIGYDAEWHCIPAAAVGAPHIRDRVFVIAYTECLRRKTWCGIEADKKDKRLRRCKFKRSVEALADTGCNRSRGCETVDRNTQIRSERIANTTDGGWWAAEPDVGRVANGIPARVDRLRGLGNSVVPQVAEWIGRLIVEASK